MRYPGGKKDDQKSRRPRDWDVYWSSLTKKQQRNLSRRQSHSIKSLLKKMEKMERLFGASMLTNIRFPNGIQHTMYTLNVGQGHQFAESREGELMIKCFRRFFSAIQSIVFSYSMVLIYFVKTCFFIESNPNSSSGT